MSPPSRLAIAYAPHRLRAAFALLLQIDSRFGDILRNAREPMIAQIKMAWWREAFAKAPQQRPKGEPLLQALNDVGDIIPLAALEALASAWETLLNGDAWGQDVTDHHTLLRAEAVFQTYAEWVGNTRDMRPMGRAWALEDLRRAFPDRLPQSVISQPASLPTARALRPLSILTMSVRTESGPRLIWHALTGR